MSKYKIGRDIGQLLARVKALEEKASRCGCAEGAKGESERTVRQLTKEEQKRMGQDKGGAYCTYFVGGFVGAACPGIAIGDFVCVSPCPPCPDINRLRVVNAAGATICILIVRWGAVGNCTDCPPGSALLTWV